MILAIEGNPAIAGVLSRRATLADLKPPSPHAFAVAHLATPPLSPSRGDLGLDPPRLCERADLCRSSERRRAFDLHTACSSSFAEASRRRREGRRPLAVGRSHRP
jgi:hypothetical protein